MRLASGLWLAIAVTLMPGNTRLAHAAACGGDIPPDAYRLAITLPNYNDTTAAFIGTVTALVDGKTARFDVEAVLRGNVPEVVGVRDHDVVPVVFRAGARYFIAAAQLPSGQLATSECKGSLRIDSPATVDEMISLSEHPVIYDGPGPQVDSRLPIGLFVVGTLAVLSIGVFLITTPRRRQHGSP